MPPAMSGKYGFAIDVGWILVEQLLKDISFAIDI